MEMGSPYLVTITDISPNRNLQKLATRFSESQIPPKVPPKEIHWLPHVTYVHTVSFLDLCLVCSLIRSGRREAWSGSCHSSEPQLSLLHSRTKGEKQVLYLRSVLCSVKLEHMISAKLEFCRQLYFEEIKWVHPPVLALWRRGQSQADATQHGCGSYFLHLFLSSFSPVCSQACSPLSCVLRCLLHHWSPNAWNETILGPFYIE